MTKDFPVEFSSDKKAVHFSGMLNLNEWNALKALASINKACFNLHKGLDGVSKTWREIKIEGKVVFDN